VPKVSQEHVATRRRQILDGARTAFSRHGYEGATVARLEEEIGLSRGAIFNYFASKWELFYALAEDDHERMGELWISGGFAAVLRWLSEQDPDWIGVYLETQRSLRTNAELREQWLHRNPGLHERLRAQVVEQQRRGELRSDVEPEDIGRLLSLVADGLALHVSVGASYDVDRLLMLINSGIAPE
jgi:TetR/AcrR family transcriptional regulator, transcriptional repressor of aconitase